MSDMGNQRSLPYPYNQDLSSILRRLDCRTPASHSKLANDPETKAYLAAAMRLIERNLGPDPDRTPIDPEDANAIERPVLGFLSPRAVADEAARNPGPFPKIGDPADIRSRWRSTSDFISDVIRFSQWTWYCFDEIQDELVETSERLLEGPDFIDAVHQIRYLNGKTMTSSASFRFQLLATAAADGDRVIRDALADNYVALAKVWKPMYAQVLQKRGLRPRPGIDLDDFTNIFIAVSEGLAARVIADPTTSVLNTDRQRNLFATVAHAVLAGCTERADQVNELTLEEVVHDMVYGESVLA
jgi:hypothetical protein